MNVSVNFLSDDVISAISSSTENIYNYYQALIGFEGKKSYILRQTTDRLGKQGSQKLNRKYKRKRSKKSRRLQIFIH